MPPNVHTFTHHPALVRDLGCYCWGAMQLKLGGSRSLLSAVGDRLSMCLITGTPPGSVRTKNGGTGLSDSTGEINGAIPSSFMDNRFTVRTGVPEPVEMQGIRHRL